MFDGTSPILISGVDQDNRCLVRMKDPLCIDVSSPSKNKSRFKHTYQSPLILTELFQHNLINVSYLTA